MNLNQEQRRHLATVFHTVGIAVVMPAFLNLTGFTDYEIHAVIIGAMISVFTGLEVFAVKILKPGGKKDE